MQPLSQVASEWVRVLTNGRSEIQSISSFQTH
nr:MAG TPA: hypothetical protein [Caudoviricetes sp.]